MDEIELKVISGRCNRMSVECYRKYTQNIEKDIIHNPKSFWSFIKSKRGGNSDYPATMTDGSVASSDATDICNMFASHFSTLYRSEPSRMSCLNGVNSTYLKPIYNNRL